MIRTEDWKGQTLYILENEQLAATLCPGLGNNMISVFDKLESRELLRVPADPEQLIGAPVHYGTPILMPPNRIRHGAFTFNGREYHFPLNPAGHHSHGFHRSQPWAVVNQQSSAEQVSITCQWTTANHPEILDYYPHELLITAVYTLKGSTLELELTVQNQGTEPAPFGFGLHTWFLLDGQADQWSLQVPSENLWELDELKMPIGRLLPLGHYESMGNGDGLNLSGEDMDTVFRIGDRSRTAVLSKPGYMVRYGASEAFKHWVIYTKGVADEFICLEPYTWVTNAPNLALPEDVTGLRAVAPQEPLKLVVTLEVEHLKQA
jgi:aldose 1-epimerase